jgi:arabinan endo-1,5-alpha-L-arabinosidase
LRDAFTSLPAWISANNVLWAPDIQVFNGQYYLYYIVPPGAAGPNNSSAIGVATSFDPAGPFLALIPPEAATNCCGGAQRWIFDSNVTSDDTGQKYIVFGSYLGGVSARTLSADGMTASAASETLVALDNRYEGSSFFRKNGYYYLFVSSGNCCNQSLTSYSMWVGRSKTPLGPFLGRYGNAFVAAHIGGTPVILMNGNSFVGPGGGVVFTDEAGQDYLLYHAVSLAAAVFSGTSLTARPVLLDALDWDVDGWPSARGGFGPSDLNSPQPIPAAQPGESNAHVATFASNDTPGQAIPGLSDEVNSLALNLQTQWTFLHSTPAYSMTGQNRSGFLVDFDYIHVSTMP